MNESNDDLRAVIVHVIVTVGFAIGLAAVGAASSTPLSTVLFVASPIVALLGALAMLWRTYRVWRRAGRWQLWQGGSWFLLAFFVVMLFGSAPALVN